MPVSLRAQADASVSQMETYSKWKTHLKHVTSVTSQPRAQREGLRTPTDETKMLRSGGFFVIQKLSRKARFVTKHFKQRW